MLRLSSSGTYLTSKAAESKEEAVSARTRKSKASDVAPKTPTKTASPRKGSKARNSFPSSSTSSSPLLFANLPPPHLQFYIYEIVDDD